MRSPTYTRTHTHPRTHAPTHTHTHTHTLTHTHTHTHTLSQRRHDLSLPVMDRALFHVDNCYKIPNVRAVGRLCKTNIASNTAFRGFGGPQSMMICEAWIDDIAASLGKTPEEIRTTNFYAEGDTTHYLQALEGCHIDRIWTQLHETSSFDTKRAEVDAFNAQHNWRKRGLAMVPTKFG